MPIRPGLCSVTYRALSAADVAALTAGAGLRAVEWGADSHARPNDTDALACVARVSAEHGLAVASLGSYYRGRGDFGPDLAAATAIGAPRVRVWAGTAGSADTGPDERRAIARDLRAAADLAAAHGVDLAFEFHRNTLTDTVDSTLRLLDEVGAPNVGTYWQPPLDVGTAQAVAGLTRVLDHVRGLHVFSWWPDRTRLPLRARADLWREVFAVTAGRDLDALLEFVPQDDSAALAAEAATLADFIG